MTPSPIARRSLLALSAAMAATASSPSHAAKAPAKSTAKPPWTEEGMIQRPGMRIHYAAAGNGPPLVLLHKLGGWIADWRHIVPALAQKYRVIAIDSPGHGDSRVDGPVPYLISLPESAANIVAVLDELGIDKFALVGNSLGGCIGVCVAALWPQRVTHLGLLSVALYPQNPRSALESVEPPGTWGPNGEPLERPFKVTQQRFGIVHESTYTEQVASRAKAGAWVRAAQRGVAAAGVIDYLARVPVLTQLMYGVIGNQYQEFESPGLAVLQHGRSVHIPAAGAFAQQDNPRATEKVILDFLAEKGA